MSEDTLASFNRDHCTLGPSQWCFVSDYRAQYEEHCKDMGIKESYILSAKALTAPDTCVPVRRAACVSGQEILGTGARDE